MSGVQQILGKPRLVPALHDRGGSVGLAPASAATSAGKALEVLDLFGGPQPSLGVSEVAEAISVPKSTAHRLLKVLVEHGYVYRGHNHRYFLSARMFHLGNQVPSSKPAHIRARAGARMGELFLRTRETVQLAMLVGGDVLYVDRIQNGACPAASVGSYRPAHCTASGRALLAFAPEGSRERFHCHNEHQHTPRTPLGAELTMLLRDVRRMGYAVDREEFHAGLTCLAAPIFDITGRSAVAALSLTRRTGSGGDIRRHTAALIETARQIRL